MMGTRDESNDWECDSGPYCEHWSTPGNCDECTAELVKPYIEPLEAEIARLKSVLVEKETRIAQLLDEISRWELVTMRNGK